MRGNIRPLSLYIHISIPGMTRQVKLLLALNEIDQNDLTYSFLNLVKKKKMK